MSLESGEDGSRKRAAWVLGVIVLVAAIIAAIMVLVLGTSGDSHRSSLPPATGIVPSSGASTLPAHSAGSTRSPATSVATTTTTTPISPGSASCPSTKPCVLPGDGGQAGAAIDAYRAAHRLPLVPTTVSSDAQTCALNAGDGPACSASYFWEPVSTLDGAALVAKVTAKSSGAAWLLDPRATSFSVGWAYAPGAAGKGGLIEGVLFKLG